MIGNKLTPFKFWCQKVLPTVYDDSLSYYEYLTKLNEYLNEVIEQINTLTQAEEDFQTDLSQQWEDYKTGLNEEWLEYKNGLTDEWNEYKTQLTQAWTETKNYIDNYFDNLDVQEEINTKLDEMATDGTLTALIENVISDDIPSLVTAWLTENVDPVGSAVTVDSSLSISGSAADAKVTGDKIKNLENSVPYIETRQAGFMNTSGTYTVAGNFVSITRTFINVEEGDVFFLCADGGGSACCCIFYNGSSIVSYVQGNFKIIPKKITVPSGVNKVVFSSLTGSGNYDDVILTTYQYKEIRTDDSLYNHNLLYEQKYTSFLQANGTIASSGTFYSILRAYDTTGIKAFKFRGHGATSAVVCLKVLNGSIIGSVNGDHTVNELYVKTDSTFDSVVFASYVDGSDYNAVIFDVECTFKVEKNFVSVNDIQQFKKEFPYYETYQGGMLLANGTYYGNNFCSCTRYYEDVKQGDKLLYKGIGDGSAVFCIFYDSSNNIVSTLGGTGGKHMLAYYEITVPSGVDHLILSSFGELTNFTSAYIATEYVGRTTYDNDVRNMLTNSYNVLAGKKWVACGDSFTVGDYTGYVDANGHSGKESDAYIRNIQTYKSYPVLIATRNNMNLVMDAISGSTMAITRLHIEDPDNYPIGYKAPFSYQRYQNIPADADYITLWFDINDQAYCNLGTIDDVTNETTYGAWNVVMEYLITNYPKAKIGLIVTNAIQEDRMNFANCIRKIARKWGVGYLDLQEDYTVPLTLDINGRSELSDTAKSIRDTQYYISSGNHHPNPLAVEQESTFIEHWLRSL